MHVTHRKLVENIVNLNHTLTLSLFYCLFIGATTMSAATNKIKNFSYEQAGPTVAYAQDWLPFYGGYERVATPTAWDQAYVIKVTKSLSGISGAIQKTVLNQLVPKPVLITARVKGDAVENVSSDVYGASLYCRVRFKSGKLNYCPTTAKTKNVGTFDWRYIGINTATMQNGNEPIEWIETILTFGQISGTAWFDDVHLAEYNPLSSGLVTIMADDGYKEHLTTLGPLMKSRGLKGTLAIVWKYLLSGSAEYMNKSELMAATASGWEISSHTVNHLDLSTLTPALCEDEMYWSKRRFAEMGILVESLSLPFGGYNANVLGLNSEKAYYKSVRKVERGMNPNGSFPYDIKVQEINRTTSLQEVYRWINLAEQSKSWLVIVFHKIRQSCSDNYCTSPAITESVLDEITNSGLQSVTYNQGFLMVKP